MQTAVRVRTRDSDDTRSTSDATATAHLPPLVYRPPQQPAAAGAVTIVPHCSTTKSSTTPLEPSPLELLQRSLPMKPKKTNGDRAKAFRAKRKQYEATLATSVNALRREVDDLCFLRSIRLEKSFRSRNSRDGSLARLAQEYFALFQHGMSDAIVSGSKRANGSCNATSSAFAARQLSFLQCAMDPNMRCGELYGIAPLVEQWKRYTSFHAALRVDVVTIDVTGPSDNPVVTVTSRLHTRFSRNTIANVFPHVLHDTALVSRLVGKHVAYSGVNTIQFSDSGQISAYDSDVGFVAALLEAGVSCSDIAKMMNHAMVTTDARLGEDSSEEPAVDRVVEILSDDNDDDDGSNEQQQMATMRLSNSERDTDSEQALSPGRHDADERDNHEVRGAGKTSPSPRVAPPTQQPSSRHDLIFVLN